MAAPVLLVHSGGFTSRQWRRLGERLSAAGHRVIAPDLLGYGSSGPWPAGAPFHFDQDLSLLAGLLTDADTEPAHLVGHSYGGFLALKLALAHPEHTRSISVFEPVAFGILDEPADDEARAILGRVELRFDPAQPDVWLAQFVDWWNGPGAWAALPPATQDDFRAAGWKLFQEVVSLSADRTDRAGYGRITVSTLLIGGDRSPLPERRVLEKLAAALPRAKLLRFSDMGHMGPITHAALVNAAILTHIDQT